MKIVFMGSADFGIPSFDALLEHHEVIAVVSTPAKPAGRGLVPTDSPVVRHARSKGIEKILTPVDLKNPDFHSALKALSADLFVVIAFRILPRAVFLIPRLGTINIHASLLPKYRGPAPIQRAIEAGEKETGITIFRIDEGIDTGQILMQERVAIGDEETTPELYERLSAFGASALILTLHRLEHNDLHPLEQSHESATKAPKLSKEEAIIDWSLKASVIYNRIRAFKPFPGTCTFFNGKRLGIEKAKVIENGTGQPGTVTAIDRDFFDVQCGSGIVRVLAVKPEGKRIMNSHDFLLGNPLTKGTILG